MSFARRLATVIEIVFAGNLTAAAEAGGVPAPTLHRIMDGSVASPRIGTLRKLADGLGLPLAWLLGDMSTQEAQHVGPGIPENIWLVLSYHTRRQDALRERITALEANTADGRRLKKDFASFNFLPFTSDTPLSEGLDNLCIHLDPSNKKDLALIRAWADLSTLLLEAALQKLRTTQNKTKD